MHNFRVGDWIYNSKYQLFAKVSSVNEDGRTVLVVGGNAVDNDKVLVTDYTKVDEFPDLIRNIFEAFTILYRSTKQIERIYDWHEDAAGLVAHEAITKVNKLV